MAKTPKDSSNQLLSLLGITHAMVAKSKAAAQRLHEAADDQAQQHADAAEKLGNRIRRQGVGTDEEQEKTYCQLHMARHRMEQARELAAQDMERMPDVEAHGEKLEKAARSKVPAGQLGLTFDEDAHPRAATGTSGKYHGGEFVPKGQEGAAGPESSQNAGTGEEPPSGSRLEDEKRQSPQEDWKENGVRSAAFKSWFGDWERDPENASKVVDEWTGEPKETHGPVEGSQVVKDGKPVNVYHGTSRGGFDQFQKERLSKLSLVGPGFYFTENPEIAQTYTKKDTNKNWRLMRKLTEWDLKKAERYFNSQDAEDLARASGVEKLARSFGGAHARSGNVEEFTEWLLNHDPVHSAIANDLYNQVLRVGREPDDTPYVFNVYLNIRKPWDADEHVSREEFRAIFDALPPSGAIKSADPNDWNHQFSEMLRNNRFAKRIDFFRQVCYGSTIELGEKRQKEMVEALVSLGYDGITHIGGNYAGNGNIQHRVWIAWEPTQIKASDNVGTFDPGDPDIRKALGAEWVPPDVPVSSDGELLTLNGPNDRDNQAEMVEAMKSGAWKWHLPLLRVGTQLVTGSHRYTAARKAGIPVASIPTKALDDVFRDNGLSLEEAWRNVATPYDGWITNLDSALNQLGEDIRTEWGIDLG